VEQIINEGEEMSSNQANENMPYIVLVSCAATIGGFLFGFDSGVINGTYDGLAAAFNTSDLSGGFNIASMLLGCGIGALFAGVLADKFGRKTLLIVASVFFIVSAWGSGVASSSFEFVIYRILGGLAVGAASVMAPAYISEIAPARVRGRLISIQQIAIIFGLFSAFISNYALAKYAGLSTDILWNGFEAWRWMFWIELIPAVLFFFILFLIPESPRYLVMSQQPEKAAIVLNKLYGSATADVLVKEIQGSIENDGQKPSIIDLIDKTKGRVRPIIWVAIGLATLQQLVGINVVFYYGAVLWQAVGFSESDALLINIISAGVSIAACLITLKVIDKVGRKPLLTVGSIGMVITLSLMVFAFINSEFDTQANQLVMGDLGTLALVAANAYVFFFNLSWGPVMWVMLGEMFPNQIRGSGLAVAGLAQWGTNFAIIMLFPLMLTSIGLAGAYSFYTLCAVISIFFVIKYVQETKGRALEDMQG
jgi:SP family sugar:H+ symporter-like MFS transporter